MLCLSGFELFSLGPPDCTVISTLSIDESNQSKQHKYKNLSCGWHLHVQDSYAFMVMYVPQSIVKFNNDQSKIGLISFLKKVQQIVDHGQNIKVSDVKLTPLQRIKISFGCCPCILYVEQSMLFTLFLKKVIFNVCMFMDACF